VAGVGARFGVPEVPDGCTVAFVELATDGSVEVVGVTFAPLPQPATRTASATVESNASRHIVIAEPVRCFTSPL
jgi:hypothetical protein